MIFGNFLRDYSEFHKPDLKTLLTEIKAIFLISSDFLELPESGRIMMNVFRCRYVDIDIDVDIVLVLLLNPIEATNTM